MKLKFSLGILVCVVTVGCENLAGWSEYKYISYKEALDKNLGKHFGDVEKDRGPSDAVSETSEGNKIFIYKYTKTEGQGIQCSTKYTDGKPDGQECYGSERVTSFCNVYFTTDANTIVTSTSFRGEGCPEKIRVEASEAKFTEMEN